MAKVFVAASWLRKDFAREIASTIQEAGHKVIARWLKSNGDNYVTRDARMAAASVVDMEDVGECDVVVKINGDTRKLSSRGGKHCEFGAALITGKGVIVFGPREAVHDWNPRVKQVDDLKELLEALK